MERAATLLENLTEQEVDWLLAQGSEQTFKPGEMIIAAGKPNTALMVVQEGLLGIYASPDCKDRLVVRGPGEIIGDMSLVEKQIPTETVKALEMARLLVIPHQVLEAQFAAQPAFAARFYFSVAQTLSSRLRHATHHLRVAQRTVEELTAGDTWMRVAQAVAQIKDRLLEVDGQALRNFGEAPAEAIRDLSQALQQFFLSLDEQIGGASPEDLPTKEEIGAYVHKEFAPYLALTESVERIHSKPRSYALDYLTLEMIYQNTARGVGRLGPVLERCFLDMPPAAALRNARHLLAQEIQNTLDERSAETMQVTCLAGGPAMEVFDVYRCLEKPDRLHCTLVDFDLQALAHLAERRDRAHLQRYIALVNENPMNLILGRSRIQLPEQDLIYSMSLIDAFDDDMALKLINLAYSLLRRGGRLVVGNFHTSNRYRAMMEYILDWRLAHRSQEDLNNLFTRSAFRYPCTTQRFEPEGILLFAECIKA